MTRSVPTLTVVVSEERLFPVFQRPWCHLIPSNTAMPFWAVRRRLAKPTVFTHFA